MDPIWFLIALLATFRFTSLLNREVGPWNLLVRLRTLLYRIKSLGAVIDCFWCLSIWIGAVVTVLVLVPIVRWLLVPFALSGGAILLYGFLRVDNAGHPSSSA